MAEPLAVRRWLISLGKLVTIRSAGQDVEDYLNNVGPVLAHRFPDAAFTADSLEHVAALCIKGLPNYPELVEFLSPWWRENRPRPPAISGPVEAWRPEPSEVERARVRASVEAAIRALRSSEQPPEDRRPCKPSYLNREQLSRAYDAEGVRPPRAPPDAAA